jgi:MFS family permease
MSVSTAPQPPRNLSAADRPPQREPSAATSIPRHMAWLGVGVLVSFAIPFLLADRLGVQRDVYYGLYAAAALGLFAAWMADTKQTLRELISRRWRWALGLGVVFAAISALIVLMTEDSTPQPGGTEFAAATLWRGVVYGAIDGLLLSAFPILVVSAALAGSRLRRERGGRAAVLALAMAASLLITATYHLGYSDFRSSKVRKPVTGDLVWSVPTLATLNPIGAPIAHAGLHVAAVAHSYDTELFLPPH